MIISHQLVNILCKISQYICFLCVNQKKSILRLGVWGCLGVSTRGYIPRECFHIQNEEKIFHSLKEEIILQYLYEFLIHQAS